MTTFGEKLKHERESRGIALQQIADATRIASHHLDALERDDLASLPGGTFNKGYVRAYAQFIGLDPEAVVGDYLLEEQAQGRGAPSAEEMARELSQVVDRRIQAEAGSFWRAPAPRTIILSISLLALIVVAGWFLLRQGSFVWAPGEPVQLALPSEPQEASQISTQPETAMPQTEAVSPRVSPQEVPPPVTAATQAPPVEAPSQTAGGPPEVPDAPTPVPRASPPPVRSPAAGVEAALSVPDFGVGTGIVNRELVGQGRRFEEGSPVWFWTRIVGGRAGNAVHHVWLQGGRPMETIVLNVGGSHWRTYSRKTMAAGSVGNWAVEARDSSGNVLARQEFRCVPERGRR